MTSTTASTSSTPASTQYVAPIRHLQAPGSFLYKCSTPQHLARVEAKHDVDEIPYDRVAEAFGAVKWPHLLHLLEDGDAVLQKRVLRAMVSVFKLPQDLAMCLKQGVLEMIESGVLDEDAEIAELSATVLSVMLDSPLGRLAVMAGKTVVRVSPVFASAAHATTTARLYDALLRLSRSFPGAQLLTSNGYLALVLAHLKRASLRDELVLRALQLLKHLLNDSVEGTAFKAIEMDALPLVARHLCATEASLRTAACDVIASLACVDKAKKLAVDTGVVKTLCALLRDGQWQVSAASAGALMLLAVHDDAKRVLVALDALQNVNQLLQSSKYLVQLNAVKLVTAVASFPPARRQLNVGSTEYHLRTLAADTDALLAKSAKKALAIVQWEP